MTGGPLNSVYYWVGKPIDQRNSYLQQSYLLSLLLSATILIIGLPLISTLSNFMQIPWQYVLVLLVSSFFTVPAAFYNEVNIALGKTLKGSLYSVGFEFTKVISFITIAYFVKDLGNIFLSYAVIFGTKFLITIALGLKEKFIYFKIDKEKMKEIFSYCFPISLAGLVTFFIDKMDQFVLAGQLAKDDFAFYSMGCLIIPPLYLLEMSVNKVLIPRLSISFNTQDGHALAHFRKAVSDVGFLIIPAVFGLFYFADPITKLLYTDKFINSAVYLKIFALSYLFFLIPYDAVPRATGRTKWIFKLTLAIAPFSLAGIILSSKYGHAKDVLIVALIFKFLSRLAGLIYTAMIGEWTVMQSIPWKKLSIFTGVSLILTYLCSLVQSQFDSDLNWFLTTAPVFAILYLAALYIPHKKGIFHD